MTSGTRYLAGSWLSSSIMMVLSSSVPGLSAGLTRCPLPPPKDAAIERLSAIVAGVAMLIGEFFLAAPAAGSGFFGVESQAMRDLLKPRADVRDLPRRPGLERKGQKDRLRGVFSIMLIAGDAQANAKDHGRISAHDLLERFVGTAYTEFLQKFQCALLIEELSIPQGLTLVVKRRRPPDTHFTDETGTSSDFIRFWPDTGCDLRNTEEFITVATNR